MIKGHTFTAEFKRQMVQLKMKMEIDTLKQATLIIGRK